MTPIEVNQDLLDAEHCFEVELDVEVAEKMARAFRRYLRTEEYRTARGYALEDHLPDEATDQQERAYKNFLDRYMQRKARAARETKRPFAPLIQDGH